LMQKEGSSHEKAADTAYTKHACSPRVAAGLFSGWKGIDEKCTVNCLDWIIQRKKRVIN